MSAFAKKPPANVREAIEKCTEVLEIRKVENARLSADLLLQHVTGLSRTELKSNMDRSMGPNEINQLEICLARRMKHEPMPYITEHIEFYSIPFYVTKGVFIPRPETECLVDAALEVAKTITSHEPKVYELGVGTGAITISMALNMPEGEFVASDVSNTAVQVASQNVRKHELQNYIDIKEGALFTPLRTELTLDFDILVSNPPYIKSADINRLPVQIRDHEPIIALDGGRDGMTCIKSILDSAPPLLRPGGYILLEADPGLLSVIRTEVRRRSNYTDFVIHKDLNGDDRVCQFRLRS